MRIRTRLQVSNFLMIFVPVGITLATAIVCGLLMWMVLSHTGALGIDDQEDFDQASVGMAEIVQEALGADDDETRQTRLARLSGILDENAMRLVVTEDGSTYYEYGTRAEVDAALDKAADALADGGRVSTQSAADTDEDGRSVSEEGRRLYVQTLDTGGHSYRIALYGSDMDVSTDFLEMLVAMVAVILIAAILIALILTNHFLTRFVFHKIEEPLDILAHGVQEIGSGNLDYRILYDGNDEFAPICTEFNDMTLRLKRSVEETQRQEESRKELMAGISHDLRSPLTSIQAYVEGLLDGVAATPEKQRAYLQIIKTKAEEIQRMVSQILQFSKMDLENYPMTMEPLLLDEEVAALLDVVAPEYAAKGLEVRIVALDHAPVVADAELLRRVVVNILDNSLKYKSAAIGHADVSVGAEGDDVKLVIADDGPGVAPDALPKLFDVFYRSDASRHNPNQGSGLGLSIIAKGVSRMGGRVDARLVDPHGLVIEIVLPKGEEKHG